MLTSIMLLASVLNCAAFKGSEKNISSNFHLQFKENSSEFEDNTLALLFSNNIYILNSISVQIFVPSFRSDSELSATQLKHISRVREFLIAEGADKDSIFVQVVSDVTSQRKNKLTIRSYLLQILHPKIDILKPIKYFNNPMCNVDTTVYQNDGLGLQYRLCDYLENSDGSIQIIKSLNNRGLSEVSNNDIQILSKFELVNDNNTSIGVLIPTTPGNERSEINLEEYSTQYNQWVTTTTTSPKFIGIDKTTFINFKLAQSGKYRITQIPQYSASWILIHAPKGYGFMKAMVLSRDSVMFPSTLVLGGEAIVIQTFKESDKYQLICEFVSATSKKTDSIILELKDCPQIRNGSNKWNYSRDVRKACKGKYPNQARFIQVQQIN